MGLLGLSGAIVVFIAAGYLIMSLTGLSDSDPLFRLALAYPLGAGIVSLQMFFYALLSIPFGFYVIALPWLFSGVLVLLLKPGGYEKRHVHGEAHKRYGLLEKVLLSVILFQVIFSLLNSVALPVEGYDAWVIWLLKGKAFYLDGAVTDEFFSKALYSNGNPGAYTYPLLVPLSVAFGYIGMGHIDDRLIKILFSLYYISLLVVFYNLLIAKTSRTTALVFTAMLATVPRVMMQSGLRGTGYADLPLSVYFLVGAGFGYRYMEGGDKRDILVSALFLSLGAWTKNEGLTFLFFALGLLSIHALRKDGAAAAKTLVPAFASVLFIALPWQIYKTYLPELSVSMISDLSVSTVLSNLNRVPFILSVTSHKLFTANKYHITWGLYVILTILGLRTYRSSGYLYLQAIMWLQFICYIFVYEITPFELKPHIDTSFDRLTIHLIPLAYLCIGISWRKVFGPTEERLDTEPATL